MSTAATATMSYQNLKMASALKDIEDKRSSHREKALLIFTFQLLVDKGYFNAATALSQECSLKLDEFSICDNIDLHSIFVEFETYYHLRYQRYPQYFKKTGATTATDQLLEKMKANPYAGRRGSALAKERRLSATAQKPLANQKHAEQEGDTCFSPTVMSVESKLEAAKQAIAAELENQNGMVKSVPANVNVTDDDGCKLLKPVSALQFPMEEMRTFAEILQKDIVLRGLNTKWDDVVGLHDAKAVLQESLQYTKEFSDFFGQGLSPWRGLLLFGPPGVGKTMLAKAVATECGTTFFNISSSTIVSKWRGDSEKMVKVLFQLAKYYAPSTIFFDEFDALGSSRDNTGETEASRRLKAELLNQMDGILSSSSEGQIFILAATNIPWELDPAILRRLEKRVYIPLPSPAERSEILKRNMENIVQNVHETTKHKNTILLKVDYDLIAMKTNRYSGSDLHQIVKEAAVRKFRQRYTLKQSIRECRDWIGELIIQTEDILSIVSSILPTVHPTVIHKFQNWNTSHLIS